VAGEDARGNSIPFALVKSPSMCVPRGGHGRCATLIGCQASRRPGSVVNAAAFHLNASAASTRPGPGWRPSRCPWRSSRWLASCGRSCSGTTSCGGISGRPGGGCRGPDRRWGGRGLHRREHRHLRGVPVAGRLRDYGGAFQRSGIALDGRFLLALVPWSWWARSRRGSRGRAPLRPRARSCTCSSPPSSTSSRACWYSPT